MVWVEGEVIKQVNIEIAVSGLHVIKHRSTGTTDSESFGSSKVGELPYV